MWRSLFMALGAYVCILGLECLLIDKALLAGKNEPAAGQGLRVNREAAGRTKEFTPPDWAPWSLMSAGAVTILYSATLPNRAKEGK